YKAFPFAAAKGGGAAAGGARRDLAACSAKAGDLAGGILEGDRHVVGVGVRAHRLVRASQDRRSLRSGRASTRAAAGAARGTRRGTPSSSRAALAAHTACRSTPLRCSPPRPTAARRSR